MLQTIRQDIITDVAATKIRVDAFESVKDDSNSAMKNNTILFTTARGRERSVNTGLE
jgi:hypothetical protein